MKRKMRSVLSFVLAFVLTAGMMSFGADFTADAAEITTAAENEEVTVVIPATCSHVGMGTVIRDGETINVVIPKNFTNHPKIYVDKEWTVVPATCVSEGLKYHKCNSCGGHVDETVLPIDPDAHQSDGNYIVLTAPTCQTNGTEALKCSLCGEYYGERVIKASDEYHVVDDDAPWVTVKEPTCATVGEAVRYCSLCGKVGETKSLPKDSSKHVYSEDWTIDTPATCVSDGSMSHHCIYCGARTDVTVIPKTPDIHTYSDKFTIDIPATCTTQGKKSRHCVYCDSVTDETVIPIDENAHVYSDEYIIEKDSTCAETGIKYQICQNCGKKSAPIVIPKKEHTFGSYEIVEKSEDGKSAKVKYTCEVCGEEKYEIIRLDKPQENIVSLVPTGSCDYTVNDINMTVSGIKASITVIDFLSCFKNGSLFTVFDAEDNMINDNITMKTGYIINTRNTDGYETNYTVCVTGDVNGDGKVNAADARIALRASAKLQELTGAFELAADVNGDTSVAASDARIILRVSAGLAEFSE